MRQLLLLSIFVFGTLSCQFKMSFKQDIDIPKEAKTFTVFQFDIGGGAAQTPNTYPNIITNELRDEFLSQTRLEMDQEAGDLQFKCSIDGYTISRYTSGSDETAESNKLEVTIRIEYINTLDTKKNYSTSFTRFAPFDSNKDLTDVEDVLLEEITEFLIQDIFNKTFNNW